MGKLNLFCKAKKLYDDYGTYGIVAGICVGIVGTGVLSYKAGKRAGEHPNMSAKDKVFNVAGAVVCGVTTIVGTIFLNKDHLSKEAGLVRMLMFDEKKQEAFVNTTKKIVGEETFYEIRNAMHPTVPTEADLAALDEGQVLFLDDYTGIKFKATPAQVVEAEYRVNMLLQRRGYVSVYDYLDALQIGIEEEPYMKDYKELGWTAVAEHLPEYGYDWIEFAHKDMKSSDGTPYVLIDCLTDPHANYLSL